MNDTTRAEHGRHTDSTTATESTGLPQKATHNSKDLTRLPLWAQAWEDRLPAGLFIETNRETITSISPIVDIREQDSSSPILSQSKTPAASLPAQEALQTPGHPLDADTRAFMEARFDHDFGQVRLHSDNQASDATRSMDARAFTIGQDVVLGAEEDVPGSLQHRHLIAHELTHVIQQSKAGGQHIVQPMRIMGATPNQEPLEKEAYNLANLAVAGAAAQVQEQAVPGMIQYAPIDDVQSAWTKSGDKGKVFAILRQLPPPEQALGPMPGPILKQDPALEAWIDKTFPTGTDDNWLAHRLLEFGGEANWPRDLLAERARRASAAGQISSESGIPQAMGATPWAAEGGVDTILGFTEEKRPIKAYYFQGQTGRRALIIGGMHGNEPSGVEVAWSLIQTLSGHGAHGQLPYFTVIVIPELFPDTLALAASHRQPLGTGTSADPGNKPIDKKTGKEGVNPNRNYPPYVPGAPEATLRLAATAKMDAGGPDPKHPGRIVPPRPIYPEDQILNQLFERFRPERVANLHGNRLADPLQYGKGGAGIFVDPVRAGQPRAGQPLSPEDQLAAAMAEKAQQGGARVPWNFVGDPRGTQTRYGGKPAEAGLSLGDWGPKAGMTIITVEVLWYSPTGQFPEQKDMDKARKALPEAQKRWLINREQRTQEIEAHAEALREIFLGPKH